MIQNAHAVAELPALDFDVALVEPEISEFDEISQELNGTRIKNLNREVIVGEFKPQIKKNSDGQGIKNITENNEMSGPGNNSSIDAPKYRHETYNAKMPPLPNGSRYAGTTNDVDAERWVLPSFNTSSKNDRVVNGDGYLNRRISVYKRDLSMEEAVNSRRTFEVHSKKENTYFDFNDEYQKAKIPNVKIFLK